MAIPGEIHLSRKSAIGISSFFTESRHYLGSTISRQLKIHASSLQSSRCVDQQSGESGISSFGLSPQFQICLSQRMPYFPGGHLQTKSRAPSPDSGPEIRSQNCAGTHGLGSHGLLTSEIETVWESIDMYHQYPGSDHAGDLRR